MFTDLHHLRRGEAAGNPATHTAATWTWSLPESTADLNAMHLPAPDDADVKALLRLLSSSFELADRTETEMATWDQQPVPTAANTATVTAVNSLAAPEDFVHLLQSESSNVTPAEAVLNSDLTKLALPSDGRFTHLASSNALTSGLGSGRDSSSSSVGTHHGTTGFGISVHRTSASSTTTASDAPTPPTGRHPTAVSNAFANIGSGLAEENFNVLTPDKRTMLSIPAEYVQPTFGSRNYRHRNREKLLFSFCLCKTFCSGATCHHGAECDFIHCEPDKLRLLQDAAGCASDRAGVHSFQVHWSAPVASLADASYPRLPSGYIVYIKSDDGQRGHGNNGTAAPHHSVTQALASEMVYATVGGQEALRLPSTSPLRICKHFEREKCARGALCHFIHPVVLGKPAMPSFPQPRQQRGAAAVTVGQRHAPQPRPAAAPAARAQERVTRPHPLPLQPPQFMPRQQPAQPQPQPQPQPQQPMPHPAMRLATPPPTPAAAAVPAAAAASGSPILTASQLPPGALVRYEDVLYMWSAETKQLIPLHATNASGYPGTSGQPSPVLLSVNYGRVSSRPQGAVPGFQMPANAMLVQSASAFASMPMGGGAAQQASAPAAQQRFGM